MPSLETDFINSTLLILQMWFEASSDDIARTCSAKTLPVVALKLRPMEISNWLSSNEEADLSRLSGDDSM